MSKHRDIHFIVAQSSSPKSWYRIVREGISCFQSCQLGGRVDVVEVHSFDWLLEDGWDEGSGAGGGDNMAAVP